MDDALFGMETELAFSASKSGGDVSDMDRDRLIQNFFSLAGKRLCSLPDQHARGLFLENGARLYLDAGLHPEYCTPECRSPEEVVRWQLAGERILAELGQEVEKLQADTRVAIFRCNVDYSGSRETWGCHESYQHRSTTSQMSLHLIPHLATRIVYTGAGGFNNRIGRVEFLLSPRVPHLVNNQSADSQTSRGIYHTKNEPLGSGGFSRLHLLCGESNSSHFSTYLKFGTTALIVRLIDAGLCRGNGLRFIKPRSSMYSYARDPGCNAVGELCDGRRLTAVQVQREYLAMVEHNINAAFMPDWARQVCERWGEVLDQLEEDPTSLSTRLDWPIKYALFQDRLSRSATSWRQLRLGEGLAAELCEIDTRFGELGSRGLFHSLDRANILDHRIPEMGSVEEAMTRPPPGGRAHVRGRMIRELQSQGARYYCTWDWIQDRDEDRMYDMGDPFGRSPRWREADTNISTNTTTNTSTNTDPPSLPRVPLREPILARQMDRGVGLYHELALTNASLLFESVASAARVSRSYEFEATARFWWATAQVDLGNLRNAGNALTPILESIDQNVTHRTACRVLTRYAMSLIDRPAELPLIEGVMERVLANLENGDGRTGRARVSMFEGRLQAALGHYDEAIETMERALDEERHDPFSFKRSSYYHWLVSYLLRADQIDRANSYAMQWRDEVQDVEVLHDRVLLACAESTIARILGRHSEAVEHAKSAAVRVSSLEHNRYRLNASCALIESAVAAGDLEMAHVYVNQLDEWREIEVGEQQLDVLHAKAVFYRAEVRQQERVKSRKARRNAYGRISTVDVKLRCEQAEQAERNYASSIDERLGTTHHIREVDADFRPAG